MHRDPYALVRDVAALRASARAYKPKRHAVRSYLAERNERALAALKTPNGG